jgi:ribonuclease HI
MYHVQDSYFDAGRLIPTRFFPPNHDDPPQTFFPPSTRAGVGPRVQRYVDRTNSNQFLIYTDGSCLDNGMASGRAGCSFIFRPSAQTPQDRNCVRFPLEREGPTGELHPQTNNRAELRAVIAALQYRNWPQDGFDSLVIATDSEYLVMGITCWVSRWLRNGWRSNAGALIMNRDLWELLLDLLEWWDENSLRVQFWGIPRAWNTDADYHARLAADEGPQTRFQRYVDGTMTNPYV